MTRRAAASAAAAGRRTEARAGGWWWSAAAWPATATVEALQAHDDTGVRWETTIVGAEADPPYNRVMLSQALAGAVGERELRCASGPSGSPTAASRCELGVAARRMDPDARAVELADGERCSSTTTSCIATGSRPFAAARAGHRPAGRATFRSRADARDDPRRREPRRAARL